MEPVSIGKSKFKPGMYLNVVCMSFFNELAILVSQTPITGMD